MFNEYLRRLWDRPASKAKLLMFVVVAGAVMTIYCLVWTMTSSHDIRTDSSQPVRKSQRFSLSNQINSVRQRKAYLDIQCDAMIASGAMNMTLNVSRLSNVIVDDKYRVMYCYVPKVGCSNWKRIFLHMTGMFNKTRKGPEDIEHNEVHFKYVKRLRILSGYSISGIYHRLRNYRKFMFVREPMERLLSAYRDKFAGVGFEDKTFQKIAKEILKRFYPDSPIKENVKKGDVTFLDFVKYLVHGKTFYDDSFEYNEHWERQSRLCYPCQVNYGFIGKYTTLEEDANYILKHTGLSKYTFPKRSVFYNASKTNDKLGNYFSEIPSFYRKRLQKLYKTDYQLFGYKFPLDL
ncbi:carbohydrate sulfotransferase 11-like isoform X2 [Pecten maximus]|uniref:carbohydrate sulfotransferase 11-like isoform X2 n=1 Tax=Pecten maximus TaxID=6579 RepID=UPI0014583DDD|nr:carbohydrate sulfotransferase 11-like isoform X2 [Pecten maximus]